MSCQQCQTLPDISKKGGEVIISCAVFELCTKMALFLQSNDITFHHEDSQTLLVNIKSFQPFLHQIFDVAIFNKLELEGIRVLFLEHTHTNAYPYYPKRDAYTAKVQRSHGRQ